MPRTFARKPTGRPPVAPELRFWPKVKKTRFCWLWVAGVDKDGYGLFQVGGRCRRAHIWAWEQENGPVPEGLVLDHFRCNNSSCVRPSHLKPVTNRANTLRGNGPSAKNARATVCSRGHSDWVHSKRGRHCKTCKREDSRKRQKTEARKTYAREYARNRRAKQRV